MSIIEKIVDGCKVRIDSREYGVLGKTMYVTEKCPDVPYAKILLENHYVLVISPSDEVAYFGKNEGRIVEFDGYQTDVSYNGVHYSQVAHDYQIVVSIVFGNPLNVEGEVEYWDYESEDRIISVAVTSREKKRADVVAKYIGLSDIEIL